MTEQHSGNTGLSGVQATVVIATPARYLRRLANHFRHRITVDLQPEAATLHFQDGTGTLAAHGEELVMRLEARDPEVLARYQEVVTRHLKQVAPKETFEVNWTAATRG